MSQTSKTRIKHIIPAALLCTIATPAMAQESDDNAGRVKPLENLEYKIEVQGSASHGKTPLWLNANKHGLSSLATSNGYVRGAITRPMDDMKERKWDLGYGLDMAVAKSYTSRAILQQAYVEGRYKHGLLSIGSKERSLELKNDELSSGSQTLGINSRPIPQVRIDLLQWTIPYTKGWLHLRGHIAYGMMTDDNWQHEFTAQQTKYTDNVHFHSKAGYLTIGNPKRFSPWSLELGLEMATLFGGKAYNATTDGDMDAMETHVNLKSYWRAFFPGGADAGETKYQNAEGDVLGSWVMRLKYDNDINAFAFYADKFFEDHSAMLFADYNGYGEGEEWNVKKERRYIVYDFKDWQLGFEFNHRPNAWLNDFVLEFMHTKYQSGPIYHDHTKNISYHLGGQDNFYNHYFYPGWQHWGQTIGNPLYRSPIYNDDGNINFQNNRFVAWHMGLGGHPTDQLRYRLLATCQKGYGTYDSPYNRARHNVSIMGEATYTFAETRYNWLNGISIKGAAGADWGSILGDTNYGFQITLTKRGALKL